MGMFFDASSYFYTRRHGNVFDEYAAKKERKEVLKFAFSSLDKDGNLYSEINDNGEPYRVVLAKEDIFPEWLLKKKGRVRADVGFEYPVAVKEVDVASRTIYMSRLLAIDVARQDLFRMICHGIRNNEPVRVQARIVEVQASRRGTYPFFALDIGGLGIKGALYNSDWSTAYVSDVTAFGKVGDIVMVDVYAMDSPKTLPKDTEETMSIQQVAFRCSRKTTLGDVWNGIEKRFPEGTIVTITALELKSENFFAKVDGLDDINALAMYPDAGANLLITSGERYEAFVKKVNEGTKRFVVKPIRKL